MGRKGEGPPARKSSSALRRRKFSCQNSVGTAPLACLPAGSNQLAFSPGAVSTFLTTREPKPVVPLKERMAIIAPTTSQSLLVHLGTYTGEVGMAGGNRQSSYLGGGGVASLTACWASLTQQVQCSSPSPTRMSHRWVCMGISLRALWRACRSFWLTVMTCYLFRMAEPPCRMRRSPSLGVSP